MRVEEVEDDVLIVLAALLQLLGVRIQALGEVEHLRSSLIAGRLGAHTQEGVDEGGRQEFEG